MPQYYIQAGVRRCIAARTAGHFDIIARINEPGKLPILTRIPLADLHSPKAFIIRNHRYIRNTEYPTVVLKTEPPPIEVEPLGSSGQTHSIPLAQVAIH